HENTFSDLWVTLGDLQSAAIIIGLVSVAVLVFWEKFPAIKRLNVPGPLAVVVLAVALHAALSALVPAWRLGADHLVQVPILKDWNDVKGAITLPDFSQFSNPKLYLAAATLAIVASLETLLNLDAIDTIDPKQRHSPPNRELFAQGVGNILGGLIGALPTTSVIVRSSVNAQSGNATKMSTIIHGLLIALCVAFVPGLLNLIPLSCLAAILIVTGFKLASPKLIKQMWNGGPAQFYPFAATVLGIVLTDLLIGIFVGLTTSIGFILHSNFRRPVYRVVEKHVTGDVIRIELSEQVSFLNRASLEKTFENFPQGSHVVVDATRSDFIDPDVIQLISQFVETKAPVRNIRVTLLGLKSKYTQIQADEHLVDYSTRELQEQLTPKQVLALLKEGNQRFIHGQRLQRDWSRQVAETAKGQAPLAVVLSCIDSRNSSELIFDLGIGDIFSVRIAGNVAKEKVLGSIEYSCAVAGAKLIVVMGHTSCGAVTTAVASYGHPEAVVQSTGCTHIDVLLREIQKSIDPSDPIPNQKQAPEMFSDYVDGVAVRHVQHTIDHILTSSPALARLVSSG
ncbi:MAG TPA: solute carrier family 23 protein, partial [Polyangiaceae bacterium]|nr:solute carrier family 23 protein [Polyangiaceae bacterium]